MRDEEKTLGLGPENSLRFFIHDDDEEMKRCSRCVAQITEHKHRFRLSILRWAWMRTGSGTHMWAVCRKMQMVMECGDDRNIVRAITCIESSLYDERYPGGSLRVLSFGCNLDVKLPH